MTLIDRYISRGWRLVKRRSVGEKGYTGRQMQCPHAGCGLTLTIDADRASPKGSAVSVESLESIVREVRARRYELGLTSDDVDDAAGLVTRHTQKTEDVALRSINNRNLSPQMILGIVHRALDGDRVSDEDREVLDKILLGQIASFASQKRRIPTIDTFMLIVGAMGGKIMVEWGDPPPITKRFMSGRE